jgi:hypothetical protein
MSVVPAPSAQEAAQAVATIPAQEDVSQAATPPVAPTGEGDMARLLAALLQRGGVETGIQKGPARRPAWEPHRALVCIGTVHRDPVARALRASRYEVYVANDTSQAIERMREDRMDAVVLDNEFDMMEQGAAFINREINSMRMAERRRLVFVNLSTSARTGDAHAAFLANVNLVVNTNDVAELPHALEKCVRDLNELYRDFNKALNVAEL